MIKYLGSKRLLVERIVDCIKQLSVRRVFDVFSGTSRVGHALKAQGYQVFANDHNRYAHCLAQCYVEADAEKLKAASEKLVREFNELAGKPGYFTETFCVKARYFQPHNGARVDAIREAIAKKGLEPDLEAVLLTSLMEAADRVDSTTGVQMAFLKQWAARSYNELTLRVPELLPSAKHGAGRALNLDALEAAQEVHADLAYIDPPYNQHSYLGNYHVWESLVRWDKPEAYGIAQKRSDVRTRKSAYNSKRFAMQAFQTLIDQVHAKYLLVSFNDEGYFDRETLERMLSSRGRAEVIEMPFKRYVGAQIGIYNPRGEKVGKISHLKNREYLYLVKTQSV